MTQETSSIHSSDALLAEITQLRMKVSYLEERCRGLEEMVGKNSQNNSKHPSSDGYQKPNKNDGSQDDGTIGKDSDSPHESPAPKSLRQSSGKKAGGQKGHKGSCLRSVDNPDHVVYHTIQECQHCHVSLLDIEPTRHIECQVFEPGKPGCLELTAHRAEVKVCSCGHRMMTEAVCTLMLDCAKP